MIELLLILLVVYIVSKYVLPHLLPWLLRRWVMKQFGGAAFGRQNQTRSQQQQQRRQSSRAKKKKIDPTVGEYVEFTETTVERSHSDSTPIEPEQQVSDIDWTDLPRR